MSQIPWQHALYDKIEFIWVTDHYDIHLKGLCKYRDRYCRFELMQDSDYETMDVMANGDDVYALYTLTDDEAEEFLRQKRLFELCVGYHWSYPERLNGAQFGNRWPRWFWNIIFKLYYKWK